MNSSAIRAKIGEVSFNIQALRELATALDAKANEFEGYIPKLTNARQTLIGDSPSSTAMVVDARIEEKESVLKNFPVKVSDYADACRDKAIVLESTLADLNAALQRAIQLESENV